MKKQWSILSGLALLLFFSSCAILSAGGENVEVTNNAFDVQNCTLKGKVRSYGVGFPLTRVRNVATEEWNANTVLLDELDRETVATAYFCN